MFKDGRENCLKKSFNLKEREIAIDLDIERLENPENQHPCEHFDKFETMSDLERHIQIYTSTAKQMESNEDDSYYHKNLFSVTNAFSQVAQLTAFSGT